MATLVQDQDSTTYTNQIAANPTPVLGNSSMGSVRFQEFEFTSDADVSLVTSEINLVKLPQGAIKIIPGLSGVYVSDFGASSNALDFGLRAYTDNGTAVPEDSTALASAVACTTAGRIQIDDELTTLGGMLDVNSDTGVTVYATVTGGNMPAAATVKGWIAYISLQG